jgi:hypothetical protein
MSPTSTHLVPATPRDEPRPRRRPHLRGDDGMSTVEYAIGTVAAAAFAAVLYVVISGQPVVDALTQLVQRALTAGF